MKMNPVSYHWIKGDSYTHIGFFSQELETVLPEAVRETRSSKNWIRWQKHLLQMGICMPSITAKLYPYWSRQYKSNKHKLKTEQKIAVLRQNKIKWDGHLSSSQFYCGMIILHRHLLPDDDRAGPQQPPCGNHWRLCCQWLSLLHFFEPTIWHCL